MYTMIKETLEKSLVVNPISEERRQILLPLISYIQQKIEAHQPINLTFICTHNSRRSHLAQVWAQIAAAYYQVPNVTCYSGGTEVTALFSQIAETLRKQGCHIETLAVTENPMYAIKYGDNTLPIMGFSKKYDAAFNSVSHFAAIMTCSQADEGCPFIIGAEKRIPIQYEDPKVADGTLHEEETYLTRSVQIAAEMCYVFSQIQV